MIGIRRNKFKQEMEMQAHSYSKCRSSKRKDGATPSNDLEQANYQEIKGLNNSNVTAEGRTKNNITPIGASGINLPMIQTPAANGSSSLSQAINPRYRREANQKAGSTLEIRSKEGASQLALINQFNSNVQQQPTPKSNRLPSLKGSSTPTKKDQPLSSEVALVKRDDLVRTSQTRGNLPSHQRTQSLEPISNRGNALVQFREEMTTLMTNDQYGMMSNPAGQTSVFGNYLMKVVQSVERRKKKQVANQLSILQNQTQRLAALVDAGPQSRKNAPQLTNLALQNFNSQLIPSNDNVPELKNRSENIKGSSLDGYKDSQPSAVKEVFLAEENRQNTYITEASGEGSAKKLSQQLAVVGFHSVFAEPKATEQVAFLLKEAQKKDKIFIPLERAPDVDAGLLYKEMKNAPDNHQGIVVFSKNGFVNVGKNKQTSTFVSNRQFITEGVENYILKDLPFFKKFHAMKVFKQWKYIMKWNAYTRKRQQLANNLHLTKPIMSERYATVVPLLNNIRALPFVEIRLNVTYGKKQQMILEDNCTYTSNSSKVLLERTLKDVIEHVRALKQEIIDDDVRFQYSIQEKKMQEMIKQSTRGTENLIMFTRAKREKEAEEEQYRLQKQRQALFDRFAMFVLNISLANLIEVQYENMRVFKEVFRDPKLGPQFEVAVCFNSDGQLDTDPSMAKHRQTFLNVFQNMEDAIYLNQDLIQFVSDIGSILFQQKQLSYKRFFDHMKKTLNENPLHKRNHEQIFDMLDKDIHKCREYFIDSFADKQEIYDFAMDWQTNQRDKQISLEMSFYKQTWMQMDDFARAVDRIRNQNTKIGTILVESLSLKKYLAELPKKIIDSIRSNVTNTMETETKSLREELSKTSEILDQLPGSLNVYVEQVNTLKYVKEKQEEFSQKFQTIETLSLLCKQDNIKVGMHLQQAIEEVQNLYENLPKLTKRAQEGLNQNKDTMEKIMQSSSLVLSKKIKAFEKKYVETYLQDRTRIEECAETLEELFKRSKAIHEIRSKVILYKEFMKLLYEEDPSREHKIAKNKLQCTEDYEFINDLHKQTIKLWKMLLYWRKRRHMCYNTPFLSLDTNKIIRSINKINRYFDEKLSKNDFMKEKSRPLYKVVMLQVKETSLIIEFLKDLRRDSLQPRHWIQIFNLIKAPHLKNSTSFTIVNLREYHIQNYREDIAKIIEYANTELKYERVFKSIKDEWEKFDLKIIPFKESMDAYILVETEALSTTIEENLTTLETIAQSQYAIYIKPEIETQIKVLRNMVRNQQIWVDAQNYWINLDPVLQSSAQLREILANDKQGIGFGLSTDIDSQTIEFLDLRNQFKRIMWSSFKRPQAIYNLQIQSRIDVFEKLIKHFSSLQKKVHGFLDERRKVFPRFYFLTDNQFLEFLTLANSNQDFNHYINVLFQGASQLFVTRILGKDPLQETAKLETFITKAIKDFEHTQDAQSLNIEVQAPAELSPEAKILSSHIVSKGLLSLDDQPNNDDELRLLSADGQFRQSLPEHGSVISGAAQLRPVSQVTSDVVAQDLRQSLVEQGSQEQLGTNEVSKTFEVLGMISLNKELFLFERPVPIIDGVEKWLIQVEKAMQETISKQLSYAVSSFPHQPLDEWVLDFPQQIILTTLHLILSHEVNEILEQTQVQDEVELPDQTSRSVESGVVNQGAPDQANKARQEEAPKQPTPNKDSAGEEEDPGMAEYLRRKNELKQQQIAEEEESKKKAAEEARKRFEEANELPRDPEKERREFINGMFGRDFPQDSRLLRERYGALLMESIDEQSQQNVSHSSDKTPMKQTQAKKTSFKEIIIDNMNKKQLPGLSLRIHFWINQIVKSLYRNIAGLKEKQLLPDLVLNSLQKLAMKNIIAFLLYQRDIVDCLMSKNVTDLEDFEWQSQIRLFWTGIEPQCKVLCGGWSVCQQNEYLGTTPRLTLTPLTNRYFVFMSSSLREKSAVLFNTKDSSHSIAGDIFEEFASLCMTPYKKLVCGPILSIKTLMQHLNGAAQSAFWVFFKGLHNLQFTYLQTLNKEIQLLQQQFILQSLIGNNEKTNFATLESQANLNARLNNQSDASLLHRPEVRELRSTTCFGIFGTLHASAAHYSSILAQLSASFRVLSFARPNERVLLETILKSEGFCTYRDLSKLSQEFLNTLYSKTALPDGEEHLLSIRDLRLVAKLATLVRDQEMRVYHRKLVNVRESQMRASLKAMYARFKKKEDRIKERDLSEKEVQLQIEEEERIEMRALREGLRLVVRQKLYASSAEEAIKGDQYAQMDIIEKKIQDCMELNFEAKRKEDEDFNMEINLRMSKSPQDLIASLNSKKKSGGGLGVRKKSISNEDVMSRYSSNVGLGELKHNNDKVTEHRLFIESITKVLKEIIEKLNFNKSNAQLRNCVNVFDLFRRSKAIVFVGPVCSGKTTILKIVSNALFMAFNVKLRTSVVNTSAILTQDLYGSIEAFKQSTTKEVEGEFSKSGILKLILDVFEKERISNRALPQPDKKQVIQSIFFDSSNIDQPMTECFMNYIDRTNKREVLQACATEFLMDFNLQGQVHQANVDSDERIPVTLPNGNVLLFPTDMFLFFETATLRDASPPFVSKVGLIVTEAEDLAWQSIFKRHLLIFLRKQKEFFDEFKFKGPANHLKECSEEFLVPFIEKVVQIPKINQWEYFNPKAATIQLFNLLNCVFYKLKDVVQQRRNEEDAEYELLITECERDVFWSNILLCTIWSFGAQLPKDLRKPFEEVFTPFKRKFNMGMSTSASAQTAGSRARFTLFDLFYDPESLQWELMQENIDYKLKLQFDPYSNQLLIPTIEASQCFFVMDVLLHSGMKHEENILDNKHIRLVGPTGSGKSFIMNSYLKRVCGEAKFQLIQVPMSGYVTVKRIQETVEKLYFNKRRNLLEPRDKARPIVLMIDDVHLQANMNVNILEFIRTWCMSKGYYDMEQGFFKGVGHFTTVCAENSEYRKTDTTKFPGRPPVSSRFLFYGNTLYLDDYDSQGLDRFKSLGQQWLTSKVWNTSRLLNKYYVLILNTIVAFLDKLRRIPSLHYSSILRLTAFPLFQRLCTNLVTYTLTVDDSRDLPSGQKEDEGMLQLLSYEIMRVYGDRVHKGKERVTLIQKYLEAVKSEFMIGGQLPIQPKDVEALVLGNYHERLPTAYVKYKEIKGGEVKVIKEVIRKKIKEKSNNKELEMYLETPNAIKEIFRLSRIMFKENQHLVLIGQPGCGKLEYLQLSALLNDALLLEPSLPRVCSPSAFVTAFKSCVLASLTTNTRTLLVISDLHLRDTMYVDYVVHFITHCCNKHESIMLWGEDPTLRRAMIDNERALYHAAKVKRPQEPSDEQYVTQAMRKWQKNLHIVLMIEDMSSYFEWVQLFPQIETMFEVMYMDELSNEGYKVATQAYFESHGSENSIFNDLKLTSAMNELRQLVKNQVLQCFYSPQMLRHTGSDDYFTNSVTEFIMTTDQKLNGYLYSDGNFTLSDPSHRQYASNLPVSLPPLTRFLPFLSLFRTIYDYLGLSLLVRRTYFEAFLRKSGEFAQFFQEIKATKGQLYGEGLDVNFKVAGLRDKIAKLKQSISEREAIQAKKQAEAREVESELKTNQAEIDDQLGERDRMMDALMEHMERVNGSEYMQVLTQYKWMGDKENRLLELVSVIIDKNGDVEGFNRKDHAAYFNEREELIAILNQRRKQNFDEICLNRFKDFITTFSWLDFKERPLFKLLYQYIFELFKKVNVRNSLSNIFQRIDQFKTQLQEVQFSITYSSNYIRDKNSELALLQSQFAAISSAQRTLSSHVEEAEISHMRTEHIIDQIERYTQRMLIKLQKTRRRIETVMGDALVMATSVVYLGGFSVKERRNIRRDMAEYLTKTTADAIKVSPKWTDKDGSNNGKLIRKIVKEFYGGGMNNAGSGQDNRIISSVPQGILSQETLSESLFALLFAPSCPYISDPTGAFQDFLSSHLQTHYHAPLKSLYASDASINASLEHLFKGNERAFACISDLNDLQNSRCGMSQDQSLLHRLTSQVYNGFEHDANMLRDTGVQNCLKQVHTTYASTNKRIHVASGEEDQGIEQGLSLFQVQVVTPRFEVNMNSDFRNRATMLMVIDEDEGSNGPLQQNSAWIDIKEVMLKHFLPEEAVKLGEIKNKICGLDARKAEICKNFENAFLIANADTLKNVNEYSVLKQCVEDLRFFNDEKRALTESFQSILSEHPLLSSYANVISSMFQSLKKLSKITGELTYSWASFLSIIDQLFSKTVKELFVKLENQAKQDTQRNYRSTTSIYVDPQGRMTVRSTSQLPQESSQTLEFTLDEDFFSTQVLPSLHNVFLSSFKPQLANVYNLLLALKLAYKKREVREEEIEYFFKQMFAVGKFEEWREIERDLVKMDDRLEKTRFLGFKREIIKLYPDNGRTVIDMVEKEIGQSFTYREASRIINFRIFNQPKPQLTLMEKINIGFLCPDHEFKTRLTQLVYEQLSSVFHFTEQKMKLHDFVKAASWVQRPIALIPDGKVNTINAVASIATYYGMELEIIRSSILNDSAQDGTQSDFELQQQLEDFTHGAKAEGNFTDASVYDRCADEEFDPVKASVYTPKVNLEHLMRKEALIEHEKHMCQNAKGEILDPLQTIERCAINGSWAFITAVKFPVYWHKIIALLDKLNSAQRVKPTFRLFLDLQGFAHCEIPDSFLFNFSLLFHLTSGTNSSDHVETSVQDIWNTVLEHPQLLAELTDYQPLFIDHHNSNRMSIGVLQSMTTGGGGAKSLGEIVKEANKMGEEVQGTMSEQQNRYILDEKQRELYNQFIQHQQSMAESQVKSYNEEMKSNDEYLTEVQQRIQEDNDPNFRRSFSRGSNRQLMDPSREVTPYTQINQALNKKNVTSLKSSQLDIRKQASNVKSSMNSEMGVEPKIESKVESLVELGSIGGQLSQTVLQESAKEISEEKE